jgi:hypothetical protein
MKLKSFLVVALLLMATTTIFAQGQRMTVPERVKATMDKITSPLALNDAQVTSTTTVFTDFYTAQNKMREEAQASGNRPDRSVFQKMTDDRDAKLKAIFTADQYTKFKNEVEATLRPQRPQGSGGNN